jgi:hypothetical protein
LPVKATDTDVVGAANFTVNVAFFVAAFVGLNVTLTVQLDPAAKFAGNVPQVLV